MWINTITIPVQLRPGLTTTVSGAGDQQGAGGNWTTVGRRPPRRREKKRFRRQREKRKDRSVEVRVRTMTGKGRELADMMERQKVDILCVQETRR